MASEERREIGDIGALKSAGLVLVLLALALAPAWGLDPAERPPQAVSPALTRTGEAPPAGDAVSPVAPARVLVRLQAGRRGLLGERLRVTLDGARLPRTHASTPSRLRVWEARSAIPFFTPPEAVSAGVPVLQTARPEATRAVSGSVVQPAASAQQSLTQVGSSSAQAPPAKTNELALLPARAEGGRGSDGPTSDLKAMWKLGPSAALTSSQTTVRNDRRTDKKLGLTTTDSKHDLVFALGQGSEFKASHSQRSEEWSRAFGKSSSSNRNTAIELRSQFGPAQRNSLRLALNSRHKASGGKGTSEGAREVHLALAPTGALRLTADYVTKSSSQRADQSTRTVGAVFQLAEGSEFSAQMKALSPEGGAGKRESSLKLNTNLGGGASAGKLTGEHTTARTEGAGPTDRQKWQLTSGLGQGATRTNVGLRLESQRGEGPAAQLKRLAALHLDRRLGSGLKLVADRTTRTTGTNEDPKVSSKSQYRLESALGPATTLKLAVDRQEDTGRAERSHREFSLEHRVGAVQLRAARRYWTEGAEGRATASYAVDLPTGELPAWAKDLPRAHAFDDAKKYLVQEAPKWLDLPFAGFRLWTDRRQGGDDDGRHTLGISHRGVIAGRYHVQLSYQSLPTATGGSRKGLPLLLRRQMVQIGTPVGRGLIARARWGGEQSIEDRLSRRRTEGIGLWGKLSDERSVEISVTRDRGLWEGTVEDRAGVSLLYSHEAGEDREVVVKAGYSWGDGNSGGRTRDARMTVSYAKPI